MSTSVAALSDERSRMNFDQTVVTSNGTFTIKVDYMAPKIMTAADFETVFQKISTINPEKYVNDQRLTVTICVEYKKWGVWVTIGKNSELARDVITLGETPA